MRAGLSADMLATDLAEYLVRRGVPFRETHHIAGAAVRMAEERGVPLSALAPADLRTLHPKFEDDVQEVRTRGQGQGHVMWTRAAGMGGESQALHTNVNLSLNCLSLRSARPPPPAPRPQLWSFDRSAESRDTEGGTSKRSVLEQVAKLKKYLDTPI